MSLLLLFPPAGTPVPALDGPPQMISLGIGSPAAITYFLLLGLGTNPVAPTLMGTPVDAVMAGFGAVSAVDPDWRQSLDAVWGV